jgi:hypothetical protein
MANSMLFHSSIAMAVIHAIGFLWYRPSNTVLILTMLWGIGTSIWNHGTTCSVAKSADRMMMWIGFCANIFSIYGVHDYVVRWLCLLSIYMAVLLYVAAKATIGRKLNLTTIGIKNTTTHLSDLLHILAHLSLTITHTLLMIFN